MIKPVGELLAKAKFCAGVGIMENADISILLDTESLVTFLRSEHTAGKTTSPAGCLTCPSTV